MVEPGDPLMLDKQLCFAIYAAEHAFTRFYKPRLEALGLTYPQYLVLLILWEQDGLTIKQIGQRLFLDTGTLTPLLKRMEAAGHVRRRRDDTDERQVLIWMTEKGRALREKALGVPLQAFDASGMDLADLETLRADLVRLRQRLDETGGAG